MQKVKARASSSGLSSLALSFVLPHETKPMRLPVVPAALTATMSGMCDTTKPVADGSTKRAMLCRDPCYSLWMDQTITGACFWCVKDVSSGSWSIPSTANTTISLPGIDSVESYAVGGATIDGASLTTASMVDYGVLGRGGQHIYVPPYASFAMEVNTGAAGGGTINADFEFQQGGEMFTATVTLVSIATGFAFAGIAGTQTTTNGALLNGIVPYGFVRLLAWRTLAAPTGAATPTWRMGWSTGTGLATATGTSISLFLPVFTPPEFNNSTLPYGRTRLNSSAALFTNVTAALSKEGTILAARLKPGVVDPWLFTASNLNSVHPSLRYFGPMEKGLYTFTTPSGNVDSFDDHWISMPSISPFNATARPLFNFQDIGIYNAMIFADLGSSAAGTQLAVSLYTHIEFETTSSLFAIGVSTLTLESLHAAEVALLRFGHFQENPIHISTLISAVKAAVGFVAPMVAPYVKQAGAALLRRGANYLAMKAAGDRKMTQATLQPPKVVKPPRRNKKAKAAPSRRPARRK